MTDILKFFTDDERATLARAAKQIKAAKKIAVITHMRPDGDAVGSAFSLTLALKNMGKNCVVCDESDLPSNLTFISQAAWLEKELPDDADLYIAVDSADVARLGAECDAFRFAGQRATTWNIDHHVSNTRYAKENFVRVCSANCMNFDDRFAYIVITRAMLEKYGADQGATEGFVDFPLSVDGVEICASVMEVKKGQYKISLRSKSYADVNRLAATFGGGGHVRAAGCMLSGDLYEVLDRLSYAVSQYL